jgi:hypothetical protein
MAGKRAVRIVVLVVPHGGAHERGGIGNAGRIASKDVGGRKGAVRAVCGAAGVVWCGAGAKLQLRPSAGDVGSAPEEPVHTQLQPSLQPHPLPR